MLIRRRDLPEPPSPSDDDPVLEHALTDLAWYERARDRARRWHWFTELSALLTGASTVVAAGIQAPPAVTATLAGTAVFIGGFRQIFNHTERYVLAAEAWSRLRLAIRRYRLIPEAERDEVSRQRLLEEVEAVDATELQGWAASRRGVAPTPIPGGTNTGSQLPPS
ncbi:SLATT domain-containing protein [Streptomyces sp. NPDC060366]|uniref:SLATT domain-containing protein n=1 Tax=Streptomyces sp. NPDC060366 TaxID=3347105 RepID=UPI0036612C21